MKSCSGDDNGQFGLKSLYTKYKDSIYLIQQFYLSVVSGPSATFGNLEMQIFQPCTRPSESGTLGTVVCFNPIPPKKVWCTRALENH